jgi:Zn-dependent protease with chaperone function
MRFIVYPILTFAGIVLSQSLFALVLELSGILEMTRFDRADIVRAGIVLAAVGAVVSYAMARHIVGYAFKGSRHAGGAGHHALVAKVAELSQRVGLKQAPEVFLYDGAVMDAVGGGPWPSRSTLAVSSAIANDLDSPAATAILAHALARIKTGDAALLPFLQGTAHVFTLFPARMMALLLGTSLRTAEEDTPSDAVEMLMIATLDVCLTLGGSLVVRHFARGAERRADAVAKSVVGASALSDALVAYESGKEPYRDAFTAAMNFGAKVKPAFAFVSYHVPLSGRRKSAT